MEADFHPERCFAQICKPYRQCAPVKGHEVALVDLYDGIENDRPAESFSPRHCGTVHRDIPETEPDLEAIIKSHGGRREWVGPRVIEMCRFADRVFLGLHGSHGENGQVQAVLDAFGVRYTGCGYLGCAIAMDKDVSKALISGAGYKTAAWITDKAEKLDFDRVNERIGLPCVVKPIGCGSSCGVSIVKTREEFEAAIALAASYKQLVVVEQFIKGREITISVVNHRASSYYGDNSSRGFLRLQEQVPGRHDDSCLPGTYQRGRLCQGTGSGG